MSNLPKTEIEFVELLRGDEAVKHVGEPCICPLTVRINGSEVLVERDTVKVDQGKDVLRVTMTFFPSRVEYKSEAVRD